MKGVAECIFADPIGSGFRVAELPELIDLIRTRGQDYWNSPEDSGSATLTFCPNGWENDDPDCPQVATLTFTKLDRLGFHFYYSFKVRSRSSPYFRPSEQYYASSSHDLADVTSVNWAGDSRVVFEALFVSTATAVDIVTEFLRTGNRSPNCQWVDSEVVVKREQETTH